MFKKSLLSFFVVSLLLVLLILVIGFLVFKNQSALKSVENSVITGEASYQCTDGHTLEAVFMTQGPVPVAVPGKPPVSNALVSLSLDGAPSVLLPQALSADGSRFANVDESLVFWSKGKGAMVLENGEENTYQNCIEVKADPGDLPQVYLDVENKFTLRYPAGYTAGDSYSYNLLGPDRSIAGVKFTIPASLALGTNLSQDSYLSVEHLAVPSCSPEYFLSAGQTGPITQVAGEDFTYLMASTTDTGVGNRYEEYVYVVADTSPCLAIRYFIHSTAFENYPEGAVVHFDQAALLRQFDAMRESLIIDAQFGPQLSLNADVYPLYEKLSWQSEEEGQYGEMKGYTVAAKSLPDITDISAVTQPWETYYADLLTSKGWAEDISLAAGGPGAAVTAYKKDDEYIILQYKSEFDANPKNEPAQCPCSVQFSIFTGK